MESVNNIEQLKIAPSLTLELEDEQAAGLLLLLQNGFFVEACVGCSIKDFCEQQLGLSPSLHSL